MYQLTKLKTIFDQISYGTTEMEAFNEILDFSMIAYKWFDSAKDINEMLDFVQTHEKRFLITEFMTEIADLNPEGFGDPLGEFYQKHITFGRMGQYFSPELLTDLIAQITLVDEIKKLEGNAKILDPACGSGRFLLSAARINRQLGFYGADLDPVCCKMTVMNMIMNSMTGEVACMDSLSNEFFKGYHLKTKLLNGFHMPYFVEFTDSNESFIHLKLPSTNVADSSDKNCEKLKPVYIQGDLFK